MSDFGMASQRDVNGAKAHADRIVNNLKKEHGPRITQRETKVKNLQKDNAKLQKVVGELQKDNAKLWEIVRELQKLLPVANASTAEPHDTRQKRNDYPEPPQWRPRTDDKKK